jgi:aspartate-semialdehyde dehydrogenase
VTTGLRIGVVGATGVLGSEVLALLEESSLPVRELVLVATDRSLGQEIEFRGDALPVESEPPKLRGLDLLFLCAPEGVCLEYARQALRAEVPCVDAAGALSSSHEVPLRVAAFGPSADPQETPLVVAPPGRALPWALILRPLHEAAGLRRVVGTALEAASCGGREGIESLYQESMAVFNQQDLPESKIFSRPVAFDCFPAAGAAAAEVCATERETGVTGALERLLGSDVKLALTGIQVPAFVGLGGTAALETADELDPKRAEALLGQAPGVELWEGETDGLTLRAAVGREEVLVGRVRRDESVEHGLLLWFAADVLRLAAANAVSLAVARLRLHH